MGTYRQWLDDAPLPSWLRARWAFRWLYLVAVFADAIGEATMQAVKARFIDTCPDDAVPYIGDDRQIEIGIGEPLSSYRERLKGAWQAWAMAGTEAGLLAQLQAWLPDATWSIVANGEWSVPPDGRPASPGLVAIDGADWWSRMWVLCQGGHPWRAWLLGDPPDGDGILLGDTSVSIGSTAIPYHAETCARIVRKWKAGHEYVPHVLVNLDTVIIGTDVPIGTFELGGDVARWPVS